MQLTRNALAALLFTGMVALPVENLWANSGGTDETIGGDKWYIGGNGKQPARITLLSTRRAYPYAQPVAIPVPFLAKV